MQKLGLLLAVSVAQGAIGYIQYFNDIPAFLVGVHVAGATAVWSATLMLLLGMYEHTPAPLPDEGAADALLAPA
jgi:cytochrome c oxidase assembly protein subunit 15